MIWWIALIGSIAGLLVILPYGLLLFAEAAREAGDTRGRRPCPPVKAPESFPARMPVAKLTRREYRRICKTQATFRRQAYIRNPYYTFSH